MNFISIKHHMVAVWPAIQSTLGPAFLHHDPMVPNGWESCSYGTKASPFLHIGPHLSSIDTIDVCQIAQSHLSIYILILIYL